MSLRTGPCRLASLLVALAAFAVPRPAPAQSLVPLSRAQAIDAALSRGARLGVARADTAIAYAALISARAFQNPTLSTSYSKSTPQYHVTVDLPLDFPALRAARIGSANAARRAAQLRFDSSALPSRWMQTRLIRAPSRRSSTRGCRDATRSTRIRCSPLQLRAKRQAMRASSTSSSLA